MSTRARLLLLPCLLGATACFAEPPLTAGSRATDGDTDPEGSEVSATASLTDPSATSVGTSGAQPPALTTTSSTSSGESSGLTTSGSSDDDSGSSGDDSSSSGDDSSSSGDDSSSSRSHGTQSDSHSTSSSSGDGSQTASTTSDDTSTGSDTTTSTSTSTTGDPPDPCGDGVLEGDEHCDHGAANGVEPGDCAPDCSAFIHEATVMVTDTNLDGSFAFGDSAVAIADSVCETEFGVGARAMFSVGTSRRATVTPLAGDGSIDWVLNPWTRYSNDNGDLVWITHAIPLLGVHEGPMQDLLAAIWISPDNNPAFTGMNTNWTTLTENDCNGWTSPVGSMSSGNPWFVEPDFLRLPGNSTCGNSRGLYCVVDG